MFPRFSGVGLLDDHSSSNSWRTVCPSVTRRSSGGKSWIWWPLAGRWPRSPSTCRSARKVIYPWRRQQLIDSGQIPGMTSTDHAELVAARKRIAELENELAIHRRAAGLLGDAVSPKGGMR